MKRMTLDEVQADIPTSLERGSPRERIYLLAVIADLHHAIDGQSEVIAQLRRDVAFEQAVNERVGVIVVDMFKKLKGTTYE